MLRTRRDSGTMIAGIVLVVSYVSFYQAYAGRVEDPSVVEPARGIEGMPPSIPLDPRPYKASKEARSGAAVYEIYCLGCHGASGDGQGLAAAWLKPKPRNFQSGRFKFVTSLPQSLPRREDLLKTVTEGLPGSSMPSFRLLSERDRRDVVEYVLHLTRNARYWKVAKVFIKEGLEDSDEDDPFTAAKLKEILADNADILAVKEARPFFPEVPETELSLENLSLGHRKFMTYCNSCHGPDGKGLPMVKSDGSPQLDEFGEPSIPRDLTRGVYRHGRSALDIWYRIKRGLDGAVMPAAGNWTSVEAWNVAHYTRLLFDQELQARFPIARVEARSALETLPAEIAAVQSELEASSGGTVALSLSGRLEELKARLKAAEALLEAAEDDD